MTLITNQMIWEKLLEIESSIRLNADTKLREELREFSLNEASKLLGISSQTLRLKAENLEIECMVEERSNAKNGITFRFTAKQIKEYQQNRKYAPVKEVITSSEIDEMINDSFKSDFIRSNKK